MRAERKKVLIWLNLLIFLKQLCIHLIETSTHLDSRSMVNPSTAQLEILRLSLPYSIETNEIVLTIIWIARYKRLNQQTIQFDPEAYLHRKEASSPCVE